MFARYFHGGYNATTSILLAVLFNVALFLVSELATNLMLPFISLATLVGFPVIAWGLAAAAKGPNTSGIGTFLCWLFALLQVGLCVIIVMGMFI